MATEIVLVGLATDGPSNVLNRPASYREAKAIYGGNYFQREVVTATASSITLEYEPFNLKTSNFVGGVKDRLYNPIATSSTLLFGSLGSSALVDIGYQPYLGTSDLLYAAGRYHDRVGTVPWMLRISGTRASVTVGGWIFEAKYDGERYNKVLLSWDGTTFSVSGLYPNYANINLTANDRTLEKTLVNAYQAGLTPIVPVQTVGALATGIWQLSGGDDGDLTSTSILAALRDVDFPIEATHIVILTPASSSIIDAITTKMLTEREQPRMYMLPAPLYTAPVSGYVASLSSTVPYRHNMVTMVLGTVLSRREGGVQYTRYAVEDAAISLHTLPLGNLTNLPIPCDSFSPILSETDLDRMVSNGIVPITRHIMNEVSVYQGTNSAKQYSFLFTSKLAEVVAAAQSVLVQYYGVPLRNGVYQDLAKAVSDKIKSNVRFAIVENVTVTVNAARIFCSVDVRVWKEILSISFHIRNQ